ncbi:MAG: HD domain-containing protein [Acidobacteriota bacterium]
MLKDDPETAKIPVIFLTAKTTDVDKLKGFEVGGEDYLVKPFKIHELIGKVQIFLRIKALIDVAEQKAKSARALFEIGKLMCGSLDLPEVLSAITASVKDLLHADSASIMLCDEERRNLRVSHVEGPYAELYIERTVPISESIAGWVVRRGEPVLIDDIDNDPRFGGFPRRSQVKSAMITPLTHKDVTFGTINVSYLAERRLGSEALQLLFTLSSQAALAIANARLVASIRASHLRTIEALAKAVDQKDSYTASHCDNVADYAALIAERLGLPAIIVEEIRVGGMLHDIGKIGIGDDILKKPARLDTAEYTSMMEHPSKGHEILLGAGISGATLEAVLHHHERMDGKGYPAGLAGEEIPLAARIVLVADAFDAMTTDRVYRKGMPFSSAITELRKYEGSQFDKGCIDALCEALVAVGKIVAAELEQAQP